LRFFPCSPYRDNRSSLTENVDQALLLKRHEDIMSFKVTMAKPMAAKAARAFNATAF